MARITKAAVQILEDKIEELELELSRANEWGGEMERKYNDETGRVFEAMELVKNNPLKKEIIDLFFYAGEKIIKPCEVPWRLSELLGLSEKDVLMIFDLYATAQLCKTAFTVTEAAK